MVEPRSTRADDANSGATVAQRLVAAREDTVAQVEELADNLREITEARTAVATDDEHDPEGQTIAFERAQVAALLQQARARLTDLDVAGERVAAGIYGFCEECGQPIAPERLEARPTARTCIVCASRRR
jgi:RNA polymerase-binding transcription factor DksA